MCGIAGYFGSINIDDYAIQRTLKFMYRRGPDYQCYKKFMIDGLNKVCCFLHSRLKIIDHDARSNQPFNFKNKSLIYNGEIYNYLEVKKELINLGHSFKTTSDTEVLLHAIDEWGIDKALNSVEGMWAFVLLEHSKNKLILSRDPFGEKPLYLYESQKGDYFFGSEIKFISSLANTKFNINLNHVRRFLVNGYKFLYKGNEGFFKDVIEVPKSSYFEIDLYTGKNSLTKYWYPKISLNKNLSFFEVVNTTKELLINSVQSRLRSDIPIAFCMSGGVDSNSLISIAKNVFNYDVHGFTIVNSDLRYEEQEMIHASVEELGIRHSQYPITSADFIKNMHELVSYHDGPVLTLTYYLDWQLHQAIAEQGYHVSVNGTAADELFSGYFDHQLMYLYDVRHNASLLSESIKNWHLFVSPIVRNPELKNPEIFINNPFSRSHINLDNERYLSYLTKTWKEDFHEIYFREGLLQNRMMNEIFHETTPVILHEIDLNSMYHSVESRAPFLDRKLFEFCHSIPVEYLIREGAAKAVLRESMRGIVPNKILDNKRKVGFNAPIMNLLDVNSKEVKKILFQDSPIWEILKKDPIKELIETSNLPNSDSKFIFSFISAKIFLEQFS